MEIYSFVSTPTRLKQPYISMPSILDLLHKSKNKSSDFVFAHYERVPVYYGQHFCNISGEGYFHSVTLRGAGHTPTTTHANQPKYQHFLYFIYYLFIWVDTSLMLEEELL